MMHHAITLADVLLALGGVVGGAVLAVGVLMVFAGGMSDAPSAGKSVSRQGCITAIVGLVLLLASCTAAFASTDPVKDTRQILAGTVTTTKAKNGYLSGTNDRTTAFQGALSAYKAVRAAEVPPPPVTPPAPTAVPFAGQNPIPDNFDTAASIEPFSQAPLSPEEVGAFRMLCAPGQLLRDDPLAFPGQPGASHLHQYWGNTGANANTTYQSLRTTGGTTCGDPAHPVNRTAYWIPAMLDGAGHAVKPDLIATYYKQVPAGSAECLARAIACVGVPNGIDAIFGYDMKTGKGGPTDANSMDYWASRFECWTSDSDATPVVSPPPGQFFRTIAAVAAAGCPAGAHLIIYFAVPGCWDGKTLHAVDGRSNLTYGTPETGGQKCPADHPYLITPWQGHIHFTTDANFVAGKWHLSSDEMVPGAIAGSTFHVDYFEGWSPTVKATWQRNCIDAHRTCSSGDLGNGTRIRLAESPSTPPHTLVALSSIP